MAKFRSKVVEIDAVQYTDATRDEVIAWSGAQGTSIDNDGAEYELMNLRIETLEGLRGEFYPCKPDVFAMKYEPVGSASVRAAEDKQP